MKTFETPDIRNVAFAGHSGCGKTSLAEALLFLHKQTERLGTIAQGTTISDYDPEEIRRQHSINASLLPFEAGTVKVNLLDLPGRRDFLGEIRSSLRAADGLVLVLDPAHLIETGTEFAWEWADEFGVRARAVFINKLDRESVNLDQALDELASHFGRRPVVLTLPVGEKENFKGVIDLVRMKLVEEKDRKVTYSDIPAAMAEAAAAARYKVVEAAAEGDDELTMKFLETEKLSDEEVVKGLHESTDEGRILPVVCGSATMMLGLAPLMTLIIEAFPNPVEGHGIEVKKGDAPAEIFPVTPDGSPVLYVFKTLNDPFTGHLSFFKVMRGRAKSETQLLNVNQGKSQRINHLVTVFGKKTTNIESLAPGDLGAIAKLDSTHTFHTLADSDPGFLFTPAPMPKPTVHMAVVPKGKADEDKIGLGFHRLMEADPTLHLFRDPQIHQTILEGMGDVHLDVAVHHLKNLVNVEVELQIPKVAYRETITRKAEGQGKFKKQSGGRGQYGDCWLRFEPLPEGTGFQFEWGIVGGVIPTKYTPAVEKGLVEAMLKGVLSKHPTVDLKAVCYDGSYHDVDSSEMAFKVAASLAFKNVLPKCNPIILEPIVKATILVPDKYMGEVIGDLNGKRGRILGMAAEGKRQKIEAMVPMSELFTYSRELRSITHGAGVFETEFDHYSRVPQEVQDKIVAETVHEKEEEE